MIRGRKAVIIVTAVVVILICLFALGLFGKDSGVEAVDLYFMNSSMTSIVPEEREVKYETREELAEYVITELSKGPAVSGNVKIMPKDTSWTISGSQSRLVVDFSQNFLTTDNVHNLLSTYAVVKSLCSIHGVSAVKVTVSGGELIAPDGNRIGYLSDKDINLAEDRSLAGTKAIKLYFANPDNTLSYQWRTVKLADSVSVGQNVVTELIKGPDEDTLTATLSPDTELISVEITEGTAYVNMGKSFVEKNSQSPEKERLAVYSVVNSLSELDGVTNVQFFIDGMKLSGFESIDLTMVFTRNDTIIR